MTVGILAAFAVGWPYARGSAASVTLAGHVLPWWRVMFAIGLVPAVLQVECLAYSSAHQADCSHCTASCSTVGGSALAEEHEYCLQTKLQPAPGSVLQLWYRFAAHVVLSVVILLAARLQSGGLWHCHHLFRQGPP